MGGEIPTGITHPAAHLHARPVWVLLGILLVSTGCATPVGVTYGSTQDVYRTLTRSVLSAGKPSPLSEQTLLRLGLKERFETEPEGVLRQLRGDGTGLSRNLLFTLAELSFHYAEDQNRQDHYLAAAIYAYAFMVASRDELAVALDPRARVVADIYNLGLTRGLSAPSPTPPAGTTTIAEVDATQVIIEARTLKLPFGQLELTVNPDDFVWSGYRFSRFVAVADFQVRGLLNRYRQAGVGAPLAADLVPVATGEEAERARRHIAPRTKVPVTAILRLQDVGRDLATGRVRGQIELYAADTARTFEIEGRKVPLELEPSAALAYQLEGAPVWETELGGFLSATLRLSSESLFTLHPYRPGRVPVVLVHGTASSPARWADLVNEVQNDPALRERVQIWLFIYNTSNPILYSASELRRTLQDIVTELDPEGRDPALRQMVLIGHSQGGLLTRLMVTHSGNRFWDNVSRVPFSEVPMSAETRALFERSMFFEPLPFVKRVVFVATPHRGSYRVSTLVLNLVRRLVTLPVTMTKGLQEVAEAGAFSMQTFNGMPTAVDNMRPGHPFVRTLSSSPIADGVTAHSIIAVEGEGGPQGLSDGVVAYESAHIEGVASEKIVRSSHSTQGNPETILEIERILAEHLGPPSTLKVDN
jgi:pimeloyl-ACP methyl ester carboxylesterase